MTNTAPINAQTYRLVPSHFPPIRLFEDLLDPAELDAAYALEGLTNPRLRQQAGDISLVAPLDRVTGQGTSAIMAAFTHLGEPSRFSDGRYGIYYAGLDLDTAVIESQHRRAHFLQATNEPAQVLTMRCYRCQVDAQLVDARALHELHQPDNYSPAQAFGRRQRDAQQWGILYRSVRNHGGECVAILRPPALVPPANQSIHLQFHWSGTEFSAVTQVREWGRYRHWS